MSVELAPIRPDGSRAPVSPDGQFYWDGVRWQPLFSPDGNHRWDGVQWQPVGPPAAAAAVAPVLPAASPAPEPEHPSWLPARAPAQDLAPALAAAPAPAPQAPVYSPEAVPRIPVAAPIYTPPPAPPLPHAGNQRQPAQQPGELAPWQVVPPANPLLFGLGPKIAAIAIFAVVVGGIAFYLTGHFAGPAPADDGTAVLVAADSTLTYTAGEVQKFHEHQTDTGTLTFPTGQKGVAQSDIDATMAFRVVSVDDKGNLTFGFKYETLRGSNNGSTIFFDPAKAKEITMVITSDGRLTNGGTNGSAEGVATQSCPGADQFSSIMPQTRVKQGQSWTVEFDRPNPIGSGKFHYIATSKFIRYDQYNNSKVAIIETSYKLAVDVVIDIHAMLALYGDDGSTWPAGSTISYKGSSDDATISSLDIPTRHLVKFLDTADFNFDMSFQGLPSTPQYQNLLGAWHYGGRQVSDMEKIA